jgi:hypothetical protein
MERMDQFCKEPTSCKSPIICQIATDGCLDCSASVALRGIRTGIAGGGISRVIADTAFEARPIEEIKEELLGQVKGNRNPFL